MERNQRTRDTEYKVQAVKPSKEIGSAKEERLDIGTGSRTPESAMRLAEESALLRKQGKELDKENRRICSANGGLSRQHS